MLRKFSTETQTLAPGLFARYMLRKFSTVDPDTGTQPRHVEGAGQILICTVTLRPKLVIGLMTMLLLMMMSFSYREKNGTVVFTSFSL